MCPAVRVLTRCVLLGKGSRAHAGQLFEPPDKTGGVGVARHGGDLIDLVFMLGQEFPGQIQAKHGVVFDQSLTGVFLKILAEPCHGHTEVFGHDLERKFRIRVMLLNIMFHL